MLNDPTKLSEARTPRAIMRITYLYGTQQVTVKMPGWIDWEVENNDFRSADTFRVSFALSTLPAPFDANWWSTQQKLWIEIFAGCPVDPEDYDVGQLTSQIYGQVDNVDFDPYIRIVELHGRDLTATMIDTKSMQKWQNKKSSEIVSLIAAKHGLLTTDKYGNSTVTKTSTMVGKYYQIEHARMLNAQTEWDLLCWLAQEEGYSVYVRGQTLYFKPKPGTSTADPYVIRWTAPEEPDWVPLCNAQTLSFSRSLTLARDIVVTVKSWNIRQKKGFTKTARAKHVAGSPGTPQTYSFVIPNLTPAEALKRAQAILKQLSAHEANVSATLPADELLGITTVLRVEGTNTAYDQDYYPASITRGMNAEDGYTMTVNAKNSYPSNTETL